MDTPIYDRLAGTDKDAATAEATAHTPVRRTVTLGDTTGIATVTYPTGQGYRHSPTTVTQADVGPYILSHINTRK